MSKTEIKISSFKNKEGKVVGRVRVVDRKTGETLSEHESIGSSTKEATADSLSKMYEDYNENPNPDFDVRNAPIKREPARPARGSASRKVKDPTAGTGNPGNQEEESVGAPTEVPVPKQPKGRNHIDFTLPFDGRNEQGLWEPVPQYFRRPDDVLYEGSNNATIILGRDRAPEFGDQEPDEKLNRGPEKFHQNIKERQTTSGYSDHMGAGAIDIVVGRGAPMPVESLGIDKPFVLPPLFNTVPLLGGSATEQDKIQDLRQAEVREGLSHPLYMLDAARIYISQKTDVDRNFHIKDPLTDGIEKNDLYGCSAIVSKADKIRLHSRYDVKIVTGGENEKWDSQGNKIHERSGIHLIAENGAVGRQQPIPLGDNLAAGFKSLTDVLDKVIDLVDANCEAQMQFNRAVMNHWHFTVTAAPSMYDIVLVIEGIKEQIKHLSRTRINAFFLKTSIAHFRTKYLGVQSEFYINSKYNTSN